MHTEVICEKAELAGSKSTKGADFAASDPTPTPLPNFSMPTFRKPRCWSIAGVVGAVASCDGRK